MTSKKLKPLPNFGLSGARRERSRIAAMRHLLHHFAHDCQQEAKTHQKRADTVKGTDKYAAHNFVAMRYRNIADAYLLVAAKLSTDDRLSNEYMKGLTKLLRRT